MYAHFGEPSYKCSTSCAPEERERTKPSTIFLVHCTQVEVFFFPSVFQKKKATNTKTRKNKQTNKQNKTMKASLSRGSPGKLSDEIQSMLLVNWKL